MELRLAADQGRVSRAQLFTDSLHGDLPSLVEPALAGLPLSSREIVQRLRQLDGPAEELADLAYLVEAEGF